jgi:hypothetical protein
MLGERCDRPTGKMRRCYAVKMDWMVYGQDRLTLMLGIEGEPSPYGSFEVRDLGNVLPTSFHIFESSTYRPIDRWRFHLVIPTTLNHCPFLYVLSH